MSEKVAIITRTYQRLEYLAKCISEVARLADYPDYEHIIVNQNSDDGTKEFLHSLLCEGFYKLKVCNNETNSGDAGGMKDGYDLASADAKYLMQFDADCYPQTSGFLRRMVAMMESNDDIGVLMARREGVQNLILPLKRRLKRRGGELFGDIDKATCCFMVRRSLIDEIDTWWEKEKIGWGFMISEKVKQLGYRVVKSWNIRVMHADTTPGQLRKYPHYFGSKVAKGSNLVGIRYSEMEDPAADAQA